MCRIYLMMRTFWERERTNRHSPKKRRTKVIPMPFLVLTELCMEDMMIS